MDFVRTEMTTFTVSLRHLLCDKRLNITKSVNFWRVHRGTANAARLRCGKSLSPCVLRWYSV